MDEAGIIERLRGLADHPAARKLHDDASIWLPPLGRELVLTHDSIAVGVHYLPDDDPSDIAWKLVATNLSDLAAKGAVPAGVLLSLAFDAVDDGWVDGFVGGLARVLSDHDTTLFGGDTLRAASIVLGCTAIGHVPRGESLARSGARKGDALYVTGTIGDAGLGLAAQRGDTPPNKFLQRRYRLPMPRLAVGQGLFTAGASAAMDVSDGLLIDAKRLAAASGLAASIDLATVPLSDEAAARLPDTDEGRLTAATSGDDYELLFSATPQTHAALVTLCEASRLRLTRIGTLSGGEGLTVLGQDGAPVTPDRLGYEH
ncbi:MAG: thiamine-phosphate kinase [Pacificimonas sp.]